VVASRRCGVGGEFPLLGQICHPRRSAGRQQWGRIVLPPHQPLSQCRIPAGNRV